MSTEKRVVQAKAIRCRSCHEPPSMALVGGLCAVCRATPDYRAVKKEGTTKTIVGHTADHIPDATKMVHPHIDPETQRALRAIHSLVAAGWRIRGFSEIFPTRETADMRITWRRL